MSAAERKTRGFIGYPLLARAVFEVTRGGEAISLYTLRLIKIQGKWRTFL